MHLLAAQPGDISDGTEPIDPGQDPADILFLSAADTEIAALSEARIALGEEAPTLRLTQLDWLKHPFSVDLYLDNTATRSRLVIARILGGEAYWPYGLEQFSIRLREAGVPFAALPGDDKPDPALRALSTVEGEDWDSLWSYFVEGGPENAANALRLARRLIDGTPRPPAAKPLLRAGFYWPGETAASLETLKANWIEGAPVAAFVFYRALLQGAGLQPVNRLIRGLMREGLNPLPVFVASLKDPVSAATLSAILEETPPSVVLNTTSFAVSSANPSAWQSTRIPTPLDTPGVPVLQVVLAGGTEEQWREGLNGLSARDIAMNVALPEVDGRLLTRAISFKGEAYWDEATQCRISAYRTLGDRVSFVASLAANWARLSRIPAAEKRVAIILANYPNRDGRLANGVGLDTPASAITVLNALAEAGYSVANAPASASTLMDTIRKGPTNWLPDRAERQGGERLSLDAYLAAYSDLPFETKSAIEDRWGKPEDDPFLAPDGFALSIHRFGNTIIGLQPARGYNIDPEATYHAPDLVPPHHYLAFYFWLRHEFGTHAIIHLGKHGNLEWLPGKALALSEACLPEAVLGPLPHLYPFIVNDPGEGSQAKRRTQAVIIDHLTPPMTRAETYGPLRQLETLVDEYYEASGLDRRRVTVLRDEILALMSTTRLDEDAAIDAADPPDERLRKIDAWLCTLKEAQIRDGLHIFGTAPEGRQRTDLLAALARIPRGEGDENASILRALAGDFALGFDPLDCEMSAPWEGPRPEALENVTGDTWRSTGDTVERLELLAAALIGGHPPGNWPHVKAVLAEIETRLRPAVTASGAAEIVGLLTGLDGGFVPPGPSGAPTRGRPDTLPTGRNFFSVDSRALPTRTAWKLGWKSASLLIDRYLQDHGDWPRAMAITAWGTSNMRTGGDDIAQALALMGVRPRWEEASGRVTGFEILPLTTLGRPRIDVTLRVSGFFRDAFPAQIDLIDSAARAVMALDEPEAENPAAGRFRHEAEALGGDADAALRAGSRVFGSKPGAYGAGLQALIDERIWSDRADLAESYLTWGSYAYGAGQEGRAEGEGFRTRLSAIDAVIQNQDNREHDLLDSDDYYQFEGGLAAAVAEAAGRDPAIYHTDHSRPETPAIRTLREEIARVMRSRVVNPKWIDGMKRHGYKGAFELAATVDYLFAFAATTGAVAQHHFELVLDAYLSDPDTRSFLQTHNPDALTDIAARLTEAIDRGLWTPKSNSARFFLAEIAEEPVKPGISKS